MAASLAGDPGAYLCQAFASFTDVFGADAALLAAVRPRAVVCCASSDRRYSSACPDTLKLLADCGAKLYFSDCPPVPGMSVPPHQALAFTVGSAGALEARYVPVV